MSDDYATEAAIDHLARVVLTSAIDWGQVHDAWDGWPKVGQRDWDSIVLRARELAGRFAPQTEKTAGAYAHLQTRADHA